MKKLRFLFVLFFFVSAKLLAQSEKETYKFSSDIERAITKDTVPWKYQMGAAAYSISGYYKKALETWDKNGVRVPEITHEDSLYFYEFSPVSAQKYIIERSKKEQVIIINEAHTNASHRAFTYSLLQGLYDNGYRYLGLEALSDTSINERKYPVIKSGYYTREPEFGNLISAAIHIGFTLFGYEADGNENGKEREIAQAKNIANVIAKHPHSKILIHCGHDHVIEGMPNNKSWEKAMAGRLKEYTQINPFTIEQTQYSEKGDKKYNHPYIAMVNKEFPVVLIDKNGKLFNGSKNSDQIDCKIIHPESHYINNRPNWLIYEGNRKEYRIEKSKVIQYPLLVLAYRKNEFDKNGIPTDIIEILDSGSIPTLILRRGDYEIVIKNDKYKTIDRYDVKIE